MRKWSEWRLHRLSLWRCALNLLLTIFAWCFLTFESPCWRAIRARKEHYFPHIDFQRLQPLDAIRLAIQAVFLIFYIPRESRGPSAYERLVSSARAILLRIEKVIFNPFVVFGQAHTDRYTKHLNALGEGKRTFFHCSGVNAELCYDDLCGIDVPAKYFYLAYLLLLDTLDSADPEYGTQAVRLLKHMQHCHPHIARHGFQHMSPRCNHPALGPVPYTCLL